MGPFKHTLDSDNGITQREQEGTRDGGGELDLTAFRKSSNDLCAFIVDFDSHSRSSKEQRMDIEVLFEYFEINELQIVKLHGPRSRFTTESKVTGH
jgi:hypothetical protein